MDPFRPDVDPSLSIGGALRLYIEDAAPERKLTIMPRAGKALDARTRDRLKGPLLALACHLNRQIRGNFLRIHILAQIFMHKTSAFDHK